MDDLAPREEIRPQFQHTETGAKSGHGELAIRADEREGLHGRWQKTFSVTAGQHYRFSAWRRAENIAVPRRSVLARVLWRDDTGNEVQRREGVVTNFSRGVVASAEPEYPRESGAGNDGWVEMSGVYEAPPGATQARIELHLLWAPNGNVKWSDVAFLPTEAPAPRKVRLASVHYRPRGAKTPMDACRQFAPLIEEAARRKADLVVLGETLTYAGVGSSYGLPRPFPDHRPITSVNWRRSMDSTSCPASSNAIGINCSTSPAHRTRWQGRGQISESLSAGRRIR